MASLSDDDKADLVAYLDGELDEEATQALEARLSQDPAARAELESLKQVYGLLDYLPRPEPSGGFTHRTMERLTVAHRPRETGRMPRAGASRGLRAAAWIAAIVLFFGLGWYTGGRLRSEKAKPPPRPSALDQERDWLAAQPRAIRDKVDTLHGKARQDFIARTKARERKTREEWLIASRFWAELQKGTPLPARLEDFPESVKKYVHEYLRHFLSDEDWNRLMRAEGQWPLFPITLVALADKHPPALPGPRGHRRFEELPPAVQKLFKGRMPPTKALRSAEGKWPDFATALTQVAANRGLLFPHELWPYNYRGLGPEMKQFVDRLVRDVLTDEENHQLRNKTPERWPDYPLTIRDLARAHGLEPPWLVLPGSRDLWDRYRLKE